MRIIFLLLILIIVSSQPSIAQTMSNSSYKLKMGNFNFSSGDLSGDGNRLRFTAGEITPGLYSGTNYTVRGGFQYLKGEDIPFAFSISPDLIDFGTVTPNNPVIRTSDLTVSNGSQGYTVTISADKQPTSQEGYVIPGTTCDSGDCSENKAGLWNSTLAYGFGFRCDPAVAGQVNDCSTDFASTSFYKPLSISPSSQTVLSGGIGKSKKAQVSYKVNVSPAQQAAIYRNILTFIAAPTF